MFAGLGELGLVAGVQLSFECFIVCKSINWVGWDRTGKKREKGGKLRYLI